MVLALFSAYFEHTLDVSDPDVVLTAASAAAGRTTAAIATALNADNDGAQLRGDLAEAAHIGVRVVRAFVANGRLAVQGAQPPEVLSGLLAQARAGA